MQTIRRPRMILVCAALAGVICPTRAWTQTYPAHQVRVIVPAAAGGPSDVIGRVLAQKLSERLGQQFYVENIPTAAGNVGIGLAAKAAPDGYTILTPTSAVVVNPSLYAKLPYDTLKDFAPVTLVAASPHVMTASLSVPAVSVKELIAVVRANPGKYSYASPGTGTTGQLAGELFKLSLGLDLVHVPFNGGAPAILSTIGGHTPIAFTALPAAASYIKSGQIRALAVTSAQRAAEFPDVPTLAEQGFPDQVSEFVQCLLVPAGTPGDVIDKLYRETAAIVALPEVKDQLRALGYSPVANTPAEFAIQIKAEVAKWGRVIHDAGIKQIE
jgi:tripartite-type tricarboxylate transporter receptor subunit TctC